MANKHHDQYWAACLTFLVFVWPSMARADSTATPALNTLTTPDSPAFDILGISPTSIQRPTTPRALATSILSAFQSQGLTLTPNYALEVAPYWLWSHPYLSFADLQKNSFSTPLDTLTLSFGTTSSGTPTTLSTASTGPASTSTSTSTAATGVPKAALGIRTTLIQGHANAAGVAKCNQSLQAQADFVAGKVAPLIVAWAAAHGGSPPSAAQIVAWGNSALAEPDAPKVDTAGCRDIGTSKEGFVLDAAAAIAFSFPTNSLDSGKVSSYGAWATASYLTTHLSILGLGKFMQDNLDTSADQTISLDVGGRAIVAVTQFGFSAEAVYRVPLNSNTASGQYRVDTAVDFELLDGYWLSITGGHDFVDGSDWSKFFALANFKVNLGDKPTISVAPAAPAAAAAPAPPPAATPAPADVPGPVPPASASPPT